MRGETLFISADNGSVAAKLRLISSELISSFLTRGCKVTGIQVRVQVRAKSTPAVTPRRVLGETAKQQLTDLEQKLRDSPLKLAIQRLKQLSKT